MQHKMEIFVEKHKDGTYWGTITEVPGVLSSYGNTLAELKENLQQAYTDHYKLAVELGKDYAKELDPKPTFTYCLMMESL